MRPCRWSGWRGGTQVTGYTSSKWGVIGLVKNVAHDFAPFA
jgi:NAD(P)-dependent dehydrogenase (short-subunit alcohol dehydrogenase family)